MLVVRIWSYTKTVIWQLMISVILTICRRGSILCSKEKIDSDVYVHL